MFYVLQNESTAALRRVPILLTDAATGTTAQTGVATTTIFPYVNINGNAFAGGAGTIAEAGYGQYYYEFDVAEVATLGLAGIHITAAGCRDYDAIAQVAAFNLYGAAGAGISAGDVWDYVLNSSGQTAQYQLDLAQTDAQNAATNTNGIANQVWNEDLTNYIGYPVAGDYLYQLGTGTTGYAGVALTAGDVWDYAGGRTITGGIADTVQLVATPVEISYPSMAGVANTIWSTDVSGYTNPSAGYDLTQAASGGLGLTAGDVWEYDISGIVTAGSSGKQLNTAATPSGAGISAYDVWDFATRTITGGIADTVTLVTNDVNVSTGSMTGIAGTVWSTDISGYVSLSAGFDLTEIASVAGFIDSSISGVPQGVWEYDISSITTSGTAGSQLNTAALPSGAGISAYDVWAYTGGGPLGSQVEILYLTSQAANAAESNTNDIGGTVWTYAVGPRTITGGTADTVTTLTNPANITTSSMTGIAGTVWSVGSRTITGGTATTVTNPVTFESAQYAAIASSVWNAATRTLTSAGSGLTAGDVWTYASREITGGIADTVTTVSGNVVGSVGSVVGNVSGSVNSVVSDVPVNEATISADVWGYVSRTLTSGAGISAGDVWSFPTRTVTGGAIDNANVSSIGLTALAGIAETVWRYQIVGALPLFNAGQAGYQLGYVAGEVWAHDISTGFPGVGMAAYKLNTAASGAGISAADVWTYGTRTITGGIADTVTTLTNRSGFAITGGTVDTVTNGVTVSTNNDKTGYSLSSTQSFNLTGNITGNLSGSVGSVSGAVGSVTGSVGSVVGSVASVTNPVTFDSAQYAGIASSVWNAATRTLTSAGAGLTAGDVWSYVSRTLTSGGSGISAYDVWNFDPTAMTSPQAGAILTDIQTDTNTIITDIGNVPNNVWASDVSGYSTPGEAGFELSQAAAGAGLTVGDVWNAPSRTITGGIANTVSTVTNGVIVTTNNDKTGYALSGGGVSAVQSGLSTLTQAQVGTEVDSSLSDVGLTTTVTGRIDAAVSSRLPTSSYVTPPTEAAIAGTVWGYATRTLTSGGGGITAGDVWTYGTRTLTSGAGITVNAATNIINGPYFVKSNVDGQDGTLDVIRGMVQDIQLTVTDAFQNPFDVTALGLAVNFYDQAGTLVTSYGTSNLYAPAGLVQFTLDTAVTGNEGRYNLILSAAGSGNTIKFGPLQTLVRPF
jgi:hypothetical protein